MTILRKWKTMFSKFMAIGKWRLNEQVAGGSSTIVLTQYHLKLPWQGKFAKALSDYTFSSLSAPGNLMSEAYYENGDPTIMWTMERWSNQDFYYDNKRSSAAEAVDVLAKSGLVSPAEAIFIKELELLSKEASGKVSALSVQPITVMLIIDVQDGTENYFKSINHDLMLAFQNIPGVLVFQFGQASYDKTRFIVWKKFRDWDVFQYHLKEPALEPVLKFLQTSVKEPPFEKGYHHLNRLAP